MSKPFEDRTSFAPFSIIEYEHDRGRYCLMAAEGDLEPVADVFEEEDAEPNGHGWEALAESLVDAQLPEIAGKLDFTSESGTFAVDSRDLDALRRLAAVLHKAFNDADLLARLIRAAD